MNNNKNKLPLVALLGRANVGKSTLINAIIKEITGEKDGTKARYSTRYVIKQKIMGRIIKLFPFFDL